MYILTTHCLQGQCACVCPKCSLSKINLLRNMLTGKLALLCKLQSAINMIL